MRPCSLRPNPGTFLAVLMHVVLCIGRCREGYVVFSQKKLLLVLSYGFVVVVTSTLPRDDLFAKI